MDDIHAYLNHINMLDQNIEFCEVAYLDEIDKFDYKFFGISPKEASLTDPIQRLFLQTAWEAIEDAGYSEYNVRGSRTGTYVGFSGFKSSKYDQLITEVDPTVGVLSKTGKTPSLIAGRLAYLLDFRGPSMVLDTSCSGSLVAVHLACQAIQSGDCEMAIAGGASIKLSPITRTEKVGIESADGRARTFDDSSDGTGGGEGIVAILLKPLDRAIRDGDNIYAIIKGSAINSDGSSNGITAPNALAQEDVIFKAWKDSGIDPETITYIEAHGTGTKLGDPIEIDGIQRAFKKYTNKKHFCGIGSLKTNIGNLDSSAGIAGLVKAVLALKHKQLPPTNHFNKPNRNIDFINLPVFVNDKLTEWESKDTKRRCGVSAFGLSGTNCHIVLEEAPENEANSEIITDKLNILTISAKSENSLLRIINRYKNLLVKEQDLNLNNFCYSANTGRGHYSCRVALIFENKEELLEKLYLLSTIKFNEITDKDVFYGEHKNITEEEKNTIGRNNSR